LEDLSIINVLKNIDIFSCSDPTLAKEYLKFALQKNTPKYYRFDAKPLPDLASDNLCIEEGFRVLRSGKNVAVIATGFMSHKAVSVAKKFPEVTVIDLYLLNRFNRDKLYEFLSSHNVFITIEEGFLGCGGLDSCIKNLLPDKALYHLGFSEGYTFEIGDREYIHDLNGVGQKDLHKLLEMVCNG
jgi:transketolase